MQITHSILSLFRRACYRPATMSVTVVMLGALLCILLMTPASARPAQDPAVIHAPTWIIDAWPQAECSGWWVDFTGSNSTPEQWRVKLDGVVIASGTTRGNETVSGNWPPGVDWTQNHPFAVEILEGGVWLTRSDSDGVGPCGAGVCVTLQAGRQGTVSDAYIYQAFPNANYGGAVVLYTGSVNNFPHHSLLQFDLAAIPANAALSQATLTLEMDEASGTAGGGGRTITVHRITSPWSEPGVTWTNFAGQFSPTVWASFVAGNTPVRADFDVRSLVGNWLNNTYANRGFLLNHASGVLRERYHSSEAASASLRAYRPKLEICYGATLGDRVWNDANANGIQDAGEGGIDGVRVDLLNVGGAQLQSTTTSNGGYYQFNGLSAGSYMLAFTPPSGFAFSLQNAGGDDATDSDAEPFTGRTPIITLGATQRDLTWDAGMHTAGRIGDTVFYDDNRSGSQESGAPNPEVGIAGVLVQLFADSVAPCDRLVRSATTNASGGYLFDGLPAGHFCVVVPPPPGANGVLTGLELSAGANPLGLTLAAGQQRLDADFGYAGRGALRGVVYFDADQNQTQGPTEPGIPGVQVCLYADANGDSLPDSATPLSCTTTDGQGAYGFANLLPGRYVLTETNPSGLTSTTPDALATQLTVTQGVGLSDHNDFGDTATADYTITKRLLTSSPTRPGETVQFEVKITNVGTSWITALSLNDVYNIQFLDFVSATPAPADNGDDGQLDWADLTQSFNGDLPPGGSFTLLVDFRALADTSALPNGVTENRATVLSGVADPDGPNGPFGSLLTVGSKSANAPLQIISPTSLHISQAEATATHERIIVQWSATTDADIAGFNVLRRVDAGEFERRNQDMIPVRQSGGAEYQWEDFNVAPGPVYGYRLEVVLVDGRVEMADVGAASLQTRVLLPLVTR